MPRILTLTANLLAETTYTYDAWTEGATQRAKAEFFQVGGKGINVTRMLTRLGVDSVALYFPGGSTGERCAGWLRKHGVPTEPFVTPHETRTGAVVRALGRAETTFLGIDNVIDARAILACARFLDAQEAGTVLAIGGSIPAWRNAAWTPLREAITRWATRSPLAVDTYGPPLADLAALPAALVKINRKEFAGLAGVPQAELTDARMADLLPTIARASRVERWVVTDGPHAVWMCEHGGAATSITPPPIQEVSPTGSGDVLHAGILYALFERGDSLEAAVRFALPLAAANAASEGVADFDLAPFGF
jgi:fructose-1-phosphate kinase PfkB-like protein